MPEVTGHGNRTHCLDCRPPTPPRHYEPRPPRSLTCDNCGADFTGSGNAKYCSEKCKHAVAWERRKERGGTGSLYFTVRPIVCLECEAPIFSDASTRGPVPIRCTDCHRTYDRYAGMSAEERLAFHRSKWERVTGTCGLCGQRIGKSYAWPHPRSLSIDHVIPISCGGEHSLRNVQAAHLHCNLSKHNRPADDQLRLIG